MHDFEEDPCTGRTPTPDFDIKFDRNCCCPPKVCIFTLCDRLLGLVDRTADVGGHLKVSRQLFDARYSGTSTITRAKCERFFIDFCLMEVGLFVSGMNVICFISRCIQLFSFNFGICRFCLACIFQLALPSRKLYHSNDATDPRADDINLLLKA